jgi:DNA repair protein RecO (recombination protein O)
LLSRVEYGESDLIVQVFTESLGRVSALARGARKSQKRFSCLEPFHTLRLTLGARASSELYSVRDATLDRPRLSLASHLVALETASRGLSWLRSASQPRNPEPELFRHTEGFLDQVAKEPERAQESLGVFGLRLLRALGWGLDFGACASCGKPCPPGQSAFVHPSRGGLVCRACGGGPLRIPSTLRDFLLNSSLESEGVGGVSKADAEIVVDIVERALSSHTGVLSR